MITAIVDIRMIDAQQRQVGALQVRDHARGQCEFDGPGDDDVSKHHCGDRLREMERRVQRRTVGAVEQRRLQSELDCGAERGGIDADEGGDAGGNHAAR